MRGETYSSITADYNITAPGVQEIINKIQQTGTATNSRRVAVQGRLRHEMIAEFCWKLKKNAAWCAERSKLSVRLLADEFAVGKSQIADLLKNKENLLRELENGIPVSGPVVKEKALEAATLLNIKQFKASNGWLEKCLKRHNIPFRNICDKSAKVDGDLVANWKNRLPDILANYGPRNIYNLDETGLFFRVLPTAFSLKRDKCNGGKATKKNI
ncbi:hypothetical protein MML48_1g05115 [Holotrichia oblita]|uniref:Uncharacterized protein n=1 Tax=Holotrichia oblita TaxID=644536 RepID=A0ACB9TVD3_HOLOL|nr:hypothetical protein MML48_1g05115 [Holotrichia oblita]